MIRQQRFPPTRPCRIRDLVPDDLHLVLRIIRTEYGDGDVDPPVRMLASERRSLVLQITD